MGGQEGCSTSHQMWLWFIVSSLNSSIYQVGLLFGWLHFYLVTELFGDDCRELAWSVEMLLSFLGQYLLRALQGAPAGVGQCQAWRDKQERAPVPWDKWQILLHLAKPNAPQAFALANASAGSSHEIKSLCLWETTKIFTVLCIKIRCFMHFVKMLFLINKNHYKHKMSLC